MRFQAKTAKKLAECLGFYAPFETEHQQACHDQADKPGAACLGLPKRRLRGAVSAIDRLKVSMHTTLGSPRCDPPGSGCSAYRGHKSR